MVGYSLEEWSNLNKALTAFFVGATCDASATGVGYALMGTAMIMPVGIILGSILATYFLSKNASWDYKESAQMVLTTTIE